MTPATLAERFLGSEEFRHRHEQPLLAVDLGTHQLMVDPRDADIGRSIATTREWEPHVVAALHEHLAEGGRFLDVGANIGYFSALAAHRVGPSGQVVAVEPVAKNLQLIYATIQHNGFTNLRVEPFAASDTNGIVCMGTTGNSSNAQIVHASLAGTRPLYAATRRLDGLLADDARFDVIKFDIEGHEPHAWRGLGARLARDRPVVLSEFHPHCLRHNAGIAAEDYAATLFHYGSVVVLHAAGGQRSACGDVATLMRSWQQENARLGTNGTAHLDLLVTPD